MEVFQTWKVWKTGLISGKSTFGFYTIFQAKYANFLEYDFTHVELGKIN